MQKKIKFKWWAHQIQSAIIFRNIVQSFDIICFDKVTLLNFFEWCIILGLDMKMEWWGFFLLSSLLAWNINISMDRGYLNEPSSSVWFLSIFCVMRIGQPLKRILCGSCFLSWIEITRKYLWWYFNKFLAQFQDFCRIEIPGVQKSWLILRK